MSIDLLVIVGQTASGKSSLAMELVKYLPIEIIAADSRTVYKGLDIGTAKPTAAEQKLVRHYLLDVVDSDQPFNVALFQKLALEAIEEIQARHKLPVLVGGSGLYIDSIICNYDFSAGVESEPTLRRQLETLTTSQLQAAIEKHGFTMPENKLNRRYLIRALEKGRADVSAASTWREKTLVVGLKHEKQVIRTRIEQRLQAMIEDGLLVEAEQVFDKHSAESEVAKSNIYAALWPYFERKISLKEALVDFVRRDLALAKKQMTWFKRHNQIKWFRDFASARDYILGKFDSNTKD